MESTISYPYLPPEILDHIVDFLHNNSEALHRCSLVSKSWVSRAQKHIFADIRLRSHRDFDLWQKTFPDPADSPAHHTRTLTVECNPVEVGGGSWAQGFSRVERLVVDRTWVAVDIGCIFPVPFDNLALSLKSLLVDSFLLPSSQIFDLIRSLLVLEDLTLMCHNVLCADESNRPPAVTSASPKLTGTLGLFVSEGMAQGLRPLLDLPGGLHFRRLELMWCGKPDLPFVTELVTACSDTLEHLDIGCDIYDDLAPCTINLSDAMKLKDAVFRFRCRDGSPNCGWIIRMLKTITSKHQDLRRISIHVPYISDYIGDILLIEQVEAANPGMRWSELDRLLVQLRKSHSILSVCLW